MPAVLEGRRRESTVMQVELVLDLGSELGEAPIWDIDRRALIWVDIERGLIHRYDPASERHEVFEAGRSVGAASPTITGGLALAVDEGFGLLDPDTGRLEMIASIDGSPGTMMNDGKCDPAGRFWAGTKDPDGRRPIGALYRLDADHEVTRVLTGVTISNGLTWSADRATFFYVDSPTHGIDAFDFDLESGSVSNRRRHVECPKEWGLPDGMTIDEEGFLWVAFWEGSAVRRFAPDGRPASTVDFPVSLVTSCAFGGDDLADLYVTTARTGLSEAQLRSEPNAGGLFRLRPGARGLPQPPFAG
jgi:sugar lactone lactonase YvrE